MAKISIHRQINPLLAEIPETF